MKQYCYRKEQIDAAHFTDVAWDSIGRVMKMSHPITRHEIVKHATGSCGVNATLVKWQEKTDPHCIRCGKLEDARHIWTCQHSSSSDLWESELSELTKWLPSVQTSPYVIEALISGLRNWYTGTYERQWCPLHQSQNTLGWHNIMLGRFHNLWKITQSDHLLAICSKQSSSTWLAKVIIRIWKITWSLWILRNAYEH